MNKKVLFGVLATIALVLDQLSKWWATGRLRGRPPLVVIEDFFRFEYARNRGVAFSLMAGDEPWRRYLLVGVGLLALGFVFYLVAKAQESQKRLIAGLALIAGGAVGNLIDRIAHGSVVDFIVWHYRHHRWPTFNIADAALVIGVGLLCLDIIGQSQQAMKGEKADEGAEPSGKSS